MNWFFHFQIYLKIETQSCSRILVFHSKSNDKMVQKIKKFKQVKKLQVLKVVTKPYICNYKS